MFEMTYGEMFLFLWSVAASGVAWTYYTQAQARGRLLYGASMFVKRLVQDDGLRDELRKVLAKDSDTDIKFGMGE